MGRSFLRVLLLAVLPVSVNAQLAFFDFNADPVNPPAVVYNTAGVPTLALSGNDVDNTGQAGVEFWDDSGAYHEAGLAGAFNSGVNDGGNKILFSVNTTGFSGLVLGYDARATLFGPTSATLSYSVAGQPFVTIGTDNYGQDATFHRIVWNLSGISVLNDASDVRFEWTGFSGGSLTGTFRMDNLQLTTVPEPPYATFLSALVLLSIGVYRQKGSGRSAQPCL